MSNAIFVVKINWIAQPFAIVSLTSGKVAITLLIIRLLHRTSTWRKWILYSISAWTVVNGILMSVFTFVQCEDPRALWDPIVKDRTKCWKPSVQSNFSIYGSSTLSHTRRWFSVLICILRLLRRRGLFSRSHTNHTSTQSEDRLETENCPRSASGVWFFVSS